jgi:hypothetical protein
MRQGLPLVPKKASSPIYFVLEIKELIVVTRMSFCFDANRLMIAL